MIINLKIKRILSLFRIKEHLCLFVILFAIIESLNKKLSNLDNELEFHKKNNLQSYIRKI